MSKTTSTVVQRRVAHTPTAKVTNQQHQAPPARSTPIIHVHCCLYRVDSWSGPSSPLNSGPKFPPTSASATLKPSSTSVSSFALQRKTPFSWYDSPAPLCTVSGCDASRLHPACFLLVLFDGFRRSRRKSWCTSGVAVRTSTSTWLSTRWRSSEARAAPRRRRPPVCLVTNAGKCVKIKKKSAFTCWHQTSTFTPFQALMWCYGQMMSMDSYPSFKHISLKKKDRNRWHSEHKWSKWCHFMLLVLTLRTTEGSTSAANMKSQSHQDVLGGRLAAKTSFTVNRMGKQQEEKLTGMRQLDPDHSHTRTHTPALYNENDTHVTASSSYL